MPWIMGSRNYSNRNNNLLGSCVVAVFDATKDRPKYELKHIIDNIRTRGGILNSGNTIRVLGVLHKVLHPMGYQMGVTPENFLGTTHVRAMEEEVSKKLDWYVAMLQHSAEECESEGVEIEAKITAGTPIRKVVIQEVASSNANWLIIDRHLRRELRNFLKQIPCKVVQVLDNLYLEPVKELSSRKEVDYVDDVVFYSLSKIVPLPPVPDSENEQAVNSAGYLASMSSLDSSEMMKKSFASSFSANSKDLNLAMHNEFYLNRTFMTGDIKHSALMPKIRRKTSCQISSDCPVLCIACGLKTEMNSSRYSYSEIHLATNEFSADNLLGEGGYGLVYKGQLKDGQHIAAKVRKAESTQGFAEFHSEVYCLSFARHRNIVMLLGYCCKENLNILVYEYICNKSLEWHLFENTEQVLEWHQRHAIAIGTAKGLRFLHEECRGSPIIHRDMRPSNILLTHDFVPMLGDFGLAKWKINEDMQTRVLGTLGYVAPEYAENGIVSVRTDVYAFGVVLIQLISGRKVVDSTRDNKQPSFRQWALPLIETLALHELADPRLGDSYNPYELYHMARTAYLCIQTEPEMRPSMAEVLRLLEGETHRLDQLADQFIPHYKR